MAVSKADQFDGPFVARGEEPVDAAVPGYEETGGVTMRERLLVALADIGTPLRQVAQMVGAPSAKGLKSQIRRARRKLEAHARNYQLACDFIDQATVPLAAMRLHGMVQAGVPQAVFRTLEGRGILRDHRTQEGGGAPVGIPQLTVVFEQTLQAPVVAAGAIVGAPRGELPPGTRDTLRMPSAAAPAVIDVAPQT